MSDQQRDPPATWSRESALAAWSFTVTGDRAAMAQRLVGVLGALGDFARAGVCRLTTVSEGEDALSLDAETDAITAAFDGVPDVAEVDVDLDLRIDCGAGPVWEREGGLLWMRIDDEGKGPIELRLSVDIDIYAAQTWGAARDNLRLASLNGPRLSGFLGRLVALGWVFVGVYAPDYPGQVGPDGFSLPDSPEAASALLGAVEGYVDAFLAGAGQAGAIERLGVAVERWRAAGAPAVKLFGGVDLRDGPKVAALLGQVEAWLGGDEEAGAELAADRVTRSVPIWAALRWRDLPETSCCDNWRSAPDAPQHQ